MRFAALSQRQADLLGEMEWFLDEQPYSLEGELEPWFFIYDKPPKP